MSTSSSPADPSPTRSSSVGHSRQQPSRRGRLPQGLQPFNRLSIGSKQLVFLVVFELLALCLVGVGGSSIHQRLQEQLRNQAQSELAVMKNLYNAKAEQIGASLAVLARDQSLLEVLQADADGELTLDQRQALTQFLQQQLEAQELSTLVLANPQQRILVGLPPTQVGQQFDPNGLVSEVQQFPRQIFSTSLASEAEGSSAGFMSPDQIENGLIRYIVTPVVNPETSRVAGVLVGGDLVNHDQDLIESTLDTFGVQFSNTSLLVDGGYSGIYLRQGDQFAPVVTGHQQQRGLPQPGVLLPDIPLTQELLTAAIEDVKLLPQTGRLQIGEQFYSVAIEALPTRIIQESQGLIAVAGDPVALLVRGTPETAIQTLQVRTFLELGIAALVVVALHVALAILLGRAITTPIRDLDQVAQAFSAGDRKQRAEVLTGDEVGRLAQTFNRMADNIVSSEAALAEQLKQRLWDAEEQRRLKVDLETEIGKLLDLVTAMQEGDLTIQAEVSPMVTGLVADTLNRLIEQLNIVLGKVLSTTEQVSQRATDLKQLAQTVATNAAEQVDSVIKVMDLTQDVDHSAQASAMQVDRSTQLLSTMEQAVQDGQTAISELIQGITILQQSSDRIVQQMKTLGEFVGLADQFVQDQTEIASMTQVLALNATLVAARAGEQRDPRQFAVVAREFEAIADQVSTLAQQTNDGLVTLEQRTAQIHTVVSAIDTDVQKLGNLVSGFTRGVDRSSGVFHNVEQVAGDLGQLGTTISQASHDIELAIQATTYSMQTITQLAEQTAQLTQSTEQQTQQLSTLSQQLLASVYFFQIPGKASQPLTSPPTPLPSLESGSTGEKTLEDLEPSEDLEILEEIEDLQEMENVQDFEASPDGGDRDPQPVAPPNPDPELVNPSRGTR